MKHLILKHHFRWIIPFCFLFGCILIGLVFLWREPTPPTVALLPRPFSAPIHLRDRLLRWVPPGRSWNWARTLLFGSMKPITFDSEVFTMSETARLIDPLALGVPIFTNAAGTEIWFTQARPLRALRKRLDSLPGIETVIGARVTTADGICATLFSGQSMTIAGETNQVGLETQYYANTRAQSTDLFFGALFSEVITNQSETGAVSHLSVRTNLDFAARVQIPKGYGVILLTRTAQHPSTGFTGMVIGPP